MTTDPLIFTGGQKSETRGDVTPRFSIRVPEGDSREREICNRCGFVNYQNPKIVVGSVATWADRVLLCRRAIDPRREFWILPAGYLELGESPEQGARREAWEEARAELVIDGLLATYAITRISQVQLIYQARLAHPRVAPGPESLEVGLFAWDQIPWDELAFPSVAWALEHFRAAQRNEAATPFSRADHD